MSQQELADRVGTTRQWVIRLEQGRRGSTLSKALTALSVLGLELAATHDLPPPTPSTAAERRLANLLR